MTMHHFGWASFPNCLVWLRKCIPAVRHGCEMEMDFQTAAGIMWRVRVEAAEMHFRTHPIFDHLFLHLQLFKHKLVPQAICDVRRAAGSAVFTLKTVLPILPQVGSKSPHMARLPCSIARWPTP